MLLRHRKWMIRTLLWMDDFMLTMIHAPEFWKENYLKCLNRFYLSWAHWIQKIFSPQIMFYTDTFTTNSVSESFVTSVLCIIFKSDKSSFSPIHLFLKLCVAGLMKDE